MATDLLQSIYFGVGNATAMLIGEKLGQVLETVEVKNFQIPYVTNVTADYVTDAGQVKELLSRQVYSSVKWQQSVERMIADGVDTFVEIGPGETLCGMIKRIDKNVRTFAVSDMAGLEAVKAEITAL